MNDTKRHDEPLAVGGMIPEVVKRLQRLRDEAADYERALRAWLKEQPAIRTCEDHGIECAQNWDASHAASAKSGVPQAVYTPCPECAKLEATARRSAWLVEQGVPAKLAHCSIENFKPTKDTEPAVVAVRRLLLKKRGALLFYGPPGNGKTHLAIAAIREFGRGLFITNARLLLRIRETYAGASKTNAAQIVSEYSRTPFLVLDELGVSAGGKDELPAIHTILTERHSEVLPTVITTNLTLEQVRDAVGDRVWDRLRESGRTVEFKGASMRAQMAKQY